jgi:hypothetical protein
LSDVDRLVETPKLAAALQDGTLPLADVFNYIGQTNQNAKRFLLIVDQFEELYTLCSETKIRQAFLDTLLTGINTPPDREQGLKSTILITLRADFLGQALLYRTLADALQDNDLKLGPMNRAELEAAIIEPAAKCGVTFEPGLVSRILDDLGVTLSPDTTETTDDLSLGRLPLLEFALTLLWEWQSKNQLTHTGYDAIGKVDGALASYADEIYGQLDAPERATMKRVMVQMVHPGAGTEDTRRLATREDLTEADWNLVQTLADARLIVTDQGNKGQETAEIIHEALIQHWSRLREWMAADRTFRMWQERLRGAIRQWQASNQDEGALLRGVPLAEAEGWLAERQDDLSQVEKAYIQTSIKAREREQKEQVEQQQRELMAAQKLAEAERQRAEEQLRTASKLRRFTYYILAALALAVLTAIAAVFFGLDSQKQKSTAVAALETTEAVALARVNDVQLNEEIAIQARQTARAISPPTPLPDLGSPMGNGLNVAIAEFSVTDEELTSAEFGRTVAEWLAISFEQEAAQLPPTLQAEIRGPDQLFAIDGRDPIERTETVAQIATRINATIVIYGSVESENGNLIIKPEYYVGNMPMGNYYLLEGLLGDLLGSKGLGSPIIVSSSVLTNPGHSFEENRILVDRLTVLLNLVVGAASYRVGRYQEAQGYFELADSVSTWQLDQRKEALYVFMGDTAVQSGDYDSAENFFQNALGLNLQYAPAYIELGNLYYLQAFGETSSGAPTGEIDEDLVSLAIDAYKSAATAIDRPSSADIDTRANFGLGQSYLLLNLINDEPSFDQAISAFELVIADFEAGNDRVKELAAEAHGGLGLIYQSLGDNQRAVAEYHAALDLIDDPEKKTLFETRIQEIEDN